MAYRKKKKQKEEDFEDDSMIDYPDEFEEDIPPLKQDSPTSYKEDDLSLEAEEEDPYNYDIDEGGADFGNGIAPMEKHGDLLKELTNFDPYLKTKMYDWMGYKWDDEKGKYIEDKSIEPLLNYKGAKRLISILSTYTRGNNIITNLDKQSYNELLGDLIESLCFSIGPDMKEYGIESNSKFLILINDIEAAVKLVLQGAGGGKYTEFLGTTIQRSESIQGNMQNPQQGGQMMKNRGFWGKIKDISLGR